MTQQQDKPVRSHFLYNVGPSVQVHMKIIKPVFNIGHFVT